MFVNQAFCTREECMFYCCRLLISWFMPKEERYIYIYLTRHLPVKTGRRWLPKLMLKTFFIRVRLGNSLPGPALGVVLKPPEATRAQCHCMQPWWALLLSSICSGSALKCLFLLDNIKDSSCSCVTLLPFLDICLLSVFYS